MVINLWKYKKFILANSVNDLRHRYAGTSMGVFWNVLSPLAQIAVFTFVFAELMKVRLPAMSSTAGFAIYICSGMLPWVAFGECITRGTYSFTQYANYLKKLAIPEQIFVAQTAMTATLGLFVSMSLLFLVTVLMGAGIGVEWAAVPPVLLLFQLFGFGIGLVLSSLNVFFSDIGQLLGIVLQIWMWLTPIVYVKEIIPERFTAFMVLNPSFPFIDALHAAIVYRQWPPTWEWLVMLGYAAAAPFLGYLILRKLRPEIRDVL